MLLEGIVDVEMREKCLYRPGHWECGGWFKKREDESRRGSADCRRGSGEGSANGSGSSTLGARDGESVHSSDSGSMTPVGDTKGQPRKSLFYDERRASAREERERRKEEEKEKKTGAINPDAAPSPNPSPDQVDGIGNVDARGGEAKVQVDGEA